MTRKISFGVRRLAALPSADKVIYYHDTKIPGLCLAVSPAGTKTYYLQRRVRGKPKRIKLGRFPETPPGVAREKAAEMNTKIGRGSDPTGGGNLSVLFGHYLEIHSKPYKKSWQDDVWLFRLARDSLGNRQLAHITSADLQGVHAEVGHASGHRTANRMIALIRAMYHKAGDWGIYQGDNPARRVKLYPEIARDRYLQANELPRFYAALAEEPNQTFHDFILLCLYTAARRRNVEAMQWQDINFDAAVWRIPSTKSGRPHVLPLIPQAIDILWDRRDKTCPWVFPTNGKLKSKTGHMVSPSKAWKRFCFRAGLKNLRIHDLRRTLGSWQAAQGTSLPIIGRSLAHSDLSSTQIYARVDIDPVREAMTKAADSILEAGKESTK